MAFLLPNLSPSLLLQPKSSSKDNPLPPMLSSSSLSSSSTLPNFLLDLTKLAAVSPAPPPLLDPQVLRGTQLKEPPTTQHQQKDEFYVNLGQAVRSLREDLPQLFIKDLNYDIYRDDVTFIDPLNTFTGIEKYKLIFWSLRLHGRMLFKEIDLQILRIWQPSENMILIRWNLRGTPRVPWEANGQFQGTSRYKLDRKGKIYEHNVDNLAFIFPQQLKPAISVLDLVTACPASPNLTFLWSSTDSYSLFGWSSIVR